MERRTMRCSSCAHIHWSDELHACPSPRYEVERNRLVSAAAAYDDNRPLDDRGYPIET